MAGERTFTGVTKYEVDHAKDAEVLVREFKCSDSQLATFFDVTPQTIKRWKQLHPEFNSAIEEVRKVQNAAVERALFDTATGFTLPKTKVFQHEGVPVVAEYTEHVPPDVNAIQFWLKNRDPNNWKDVSKVEQNLNLAVVPVINITLKNQNDK